MTEKRTPRRKGEAKEKTCTGCGITKPISEFYPNNKPVPAKRTSGPGRRVGPDGSLRTRTGRCIACQLRKNFHRPFKKNATLEYLLGRERDLVWRLEQVRQMIADVRKVQG